MKTNFFNRNVISMLAMFLMVGTVAFAIKVQTSQRTIDSSAQSSAMQVATASPRGRGFQVQFDEPRVQEAMRRVNSFEMMKQQTARQAGKPKYENISVFRSAVEKEATTKLATLFPNGVPPGTESKVKITIKVSSDPFQISISIDF